MSRVIDKAQMRAMHMLGQQGRSEEEDTANLVEGIRVSNRRIEELEKALRWVCGLYMVADEWQGQERENRITKAMDYAIREGQRKEGESRE